MGSEMCIRDRSRTYCGTGLHSTYAAFRSAFGAFRDCGEHLLSGYPPRVVSEGFIESNYLLRMRLSPRRKSVLELDRARAETLHQGRVIRRAVQSAVEHLDRNPGQHSADPSPAVCFGAVPDNLQGHGCRGVIAATAARVHSTGRRLMRATVATMPMSHLPRRLCAPGRVLAA